VRRLFVNVALSAAVLLIGLVLLESASRALLPLSPGARFVGANGEPVEIHAYLSPRPNAAARFVQLSADYRAPATVTDEGYRGPAPGGSPDLLFIGDSFTFGQGLTDEETFAALYCREAQRRCANLGRPGTGTWAQVRILEAFLDSYGWRPREVKVFILASMSMVSGNDLYDTVNDMGMPERTGEALAEQQAKDQALRRPRSVIGWMVAQRATILEYSNLARLLYRQFGPQIRAALAPQATSEKLEIGVTAMARELRHLDRLAERHGFAVAVYVLYPMQDLLRGSHLAALEAIRRAAGDLRLIDTAPALLDDPRRYYFRYDGHFNAAGAERVAALLAAEAGR